MAESGAVLAGSAYQTRRQDQRLAWFKEKANQILLDPQFVVSLHSSPWRRHQIKEELLSNLQGANSIGEFLSMAGPYKERILRRIDYTLQLGKGDEQARMKQPATDFVSDWLKSPTFWVVSLILEFLSYATGEISNPNSLYAVYVTLVNLLAGGVLSIILDGAFQLRRPEALNDPKDKGQILSFSFRLGKWVRRLLKHS